MKRNASVVLFLLLSWTAWGQVETVYMAVLSTTGALYDQEDIPRFGLFVSTDRGERWEHRGWRDYIRTFYVEEAREGVLWSACGNGILRSSDQGRSWKVTTGWEVTEVLKVHAAEDDPRVVFAATAYGVWRTTDGGESWIRSSSGIEPPFVTDVCIDRDDWHHVLAATETGVYRTEDGGEHWVPTGRVGEAVRVVVQDLHNGRQFWAGTEEHGVMVSTDGGRSWAERSGGLADSTVYAIALHPAQEGWIYAGTFAGGVCVSTNGGREWKQSSTGLTDLQVHALVLFPSDPMVLLAGTLNDGVFRSTDGGASWSYVAHDSSQVWGLSVRSSFPMRR